MFLPDHVKSCILALESAGYPTYAVGGCVRDSLLGLVPQDYDLCTAALPEQTEAVFSGYRLVTAGRKHGTIGVITAGTVVEITTFRTEGSYRDSRHPDWVRFVSGIEEDLARRDFTVNAMAYSPSRGFADPFGGRRDLEDRILRAVGDPVRRFEEDALRILRGARFSARYRLSPESETEKAMNALAGRISQLARERVFEELCKLILLATEEDLLRFRHILAAAIPELGPMIGFDQRNRHHAHDLFTHTAQVTAAVPAELTLRWAALLHDVGKIGCFTLDDLGQGHFYGHARRGAEMADDILLELRAPTALRLQTCLLIQHHMTKIEPDRKTVRRWLNRLGKIPFRQLLALQAADMGGKGTEAGPEMDQFPLLQSIMEEILAENACLCLKDLAVNGHDLMALGFSGKAIGSALNRLLELVLEERAENKKEILLAIAEGYERK